MTLRTLILATSLLALTGCASQRIAKDMPISTGAQEQARVQLHNEIGLLRAVYEQAQRMATQRYCSTVQPHEPFILMTTGHVDPKQLSDELRAAYAQLGVDHKARVVWVDPTAEPKLKVGDVVVAINGRDIEPDEPYSAMVALRKARHDLQPDQPFKVKLDDGQSVELLGQPVCEAGVYSTYFDPYPHQLGFDLSPGIKLPTNLLKQAQTAADLRWLAAYGLYITSSPEAESRRTKARIAAVPGLAGHVALAIIPGGSWLSGRYVSKSILYFGLDGVYPTAAEFATRELHALGEDPSPGIEMFARAQAQKMQVGDIVVSDAELASIRALAAALKQGNAPQPKYELPAVASK
ncbi:hypothetical protein [Hydrogenophaga sp. PML113]|uniref:hypothetical protein n=1 Tax=Hydrogenophaga sp. PML113 TaxID=1899350 RepID=UPI000878E28C|nr:hypothetical protein [Hydrogenophaga sp. PML113]